MDRVSIDEFDNLPEWFGEEPGHMFVHPDDWDELESEAGGILHAAAITVRQVPYVECGMVYFMRDAPSPMCYNPHYNPLMRKSWD